MRFTNRRSDLWGGRSCFRSSCIRSTSSVGGGRPFRPHARNILYAKLPIRLSGRNSPLTTKWVSPCLVRVSRCTRFPLRVVQNSTIAPSSPSAQAARIKSGSNRGITAQLGLGRRALLEYCRLDAEALMKVYLELRNLARG